MKKNPLQILWLILGFAAIGLGAVGVVLPVLPTTPFLLLASFCLAKGSEKFHTWFTGTKLYKNHLDEFVQNRSMTLKTKLAYFFQRQLCFFWHLLLCLISTAGLL